MLDHTPHLICYLSLVLCSIHNHDTVPPDHRASQYICIGCGDGPEFLDRLIPIWISFSVGKQADSDFRQNVKVKGQVRLAKPPCKFIYIYYPVQIQVL